MFIDRARVFVKAGDGGDGMSSFRREKYVPNGGPSGGDGGKGADVVFKADKNINTLVDFRYKRQFKAPAGGNGESSNKHGRGSDPLIIPVPLGTVIKDEETGKIFCDLVNDGDTFVIAKGGRGGRGNARFQTSANRAPTFAEKGEPGEEFWLQLELKVLADVGLLGYPSVGKSSILRKVSKAQPEVAAYHFTTLTPVLGVVTISGEEARNIGNYRIKFGTPLYHIVKQLKITNEEKVIFGGPMMGIEVFDSRVPVIKGTSGILFLSTEEIERNNCISCGYCVEACPMNLMPFEFADYYEKGKYEKMVKANIQNCIECGACEFVCPSRVPLMESIKTGKAVLSEMGENR